MIIPLLSIIVACTPVPTIDPSHEIVVQAGDYSIGPPSTVRSPPNTLRRTVTLTYEYAISKTEVTIGDWMTVTHDLPNQFCGESPITMLTEEHPVRCVSWCEAIAFANHKSTAEGLDPVYKFIEGGEKPKHDIDCNEGAQFVEMNHNANGWRLPTEAEWEIAYGNYSTTALTEVAWFKTNANKQPHPVGKKTPNELGLYDMQGNLHEWIWERFGEFESRVITDPIDYDIPIPSLYTRPIKGGSFTSVAAGLQSYNRPHASPSMKHPSIGFRLVRTVKHHH